MPFCSFRWLFNLLVCCVFLSPLFCFGFSFLCVCFFLFSLFKCRVMLFVSALICLVFKRCVKCERHSWLIPYVQHFCCCCCCCSLLFTLFSIQSNKCSTPSKISFILSVCLSVYLVCRIHCALIQYDIVVVDTSVWRFVAFFTRFSSPSFSFMHFMSYFGALVYTYLLLDLCLLCYFVYICVCVCVRS